MLVAEIQRLSVAVTGPLQPPLTAMHATGDHRGLQRAYLRGNRYALWSILLIAPPLMIYSHEFVKLYIGEKYLLAAGVIVCMMAVQPLHYSNIMFSYLAAAAARLKDVAIRQIAVQSSTLLVALFLVAQLKLGAMGSAFAILLSGTWSAPLVWWPLGRRISGVSAGEWLRETVGPGILPALAGIAVWLPLEQIVSPSSWVALGGCVFAGVISYLTVLLVFCLRPHEREDLRRVWQTVRAFPRRWMPEYAVGSGGDQQTPTDTA
jgi:O-antigen/teichoic acid export membrane protein